VTGTDQPDFRDVLELVPVRSAEWDDRDGVVTVHRPRPLKQGVLSRLSYAMSPRRLRLDERGSLSWRCLDGGTTVAELAVVLRREFPDDTVDVEQRLVQWLAALENAGLITDHGGEVYDGA
jgi:hypothetical protein